MGIEAWYSESAFRLSDSLVRQRENSKNKEHSLTYRQQCWESSLRHEEMIIQRAELLVAYLDRCAKKKYHLTQYD